MPRSLKVARYRDLVTVSNKPSAMFMGILWRVNPDGAVYARISCPNSQSQVVFYFMGHCFLDQCDTEVTLKDATPDRFWWGPPQRLWRCGANECLLQSRLQSSNQKQNYDKINKLHRFTLTVSGKGNTNPKKKNSPIPHFIDTF